MDPLRHVKPEVRRIQAYTLAALAAPVKINQNENPWDIPERVKRRVLDKALARPWARYPDFDPRELTEALARFSGWREDGILAGNSVICPLHGWKINVESCGYPVELRDGDVYVCVPEGS